MGRGGDLFARVAMRIEKAEARRLEKLARIAGRSSSFIAAEAISEYLELNEAQVNGDPAASAENNS